MEITRLLWKISSPLIFSATISAQNGPSPDQQPPLQLMQISPILSVIDTDHDGVLSAAEIAASPAELKKLDKNGDGKLMRDEAGIPMDKLRRPGGRGPGGGEGRPQETPAPPPTADDMTTTLMMFDANHNGQLEKSEVPERFQGLFERGDTNHDGILTKDEITALAQSSREMKYPPRPNRMDMAFNALDTDGDGQISAAEIDAAPKSLLVLDKNSDGQITLDEVTPAQRRPQGEHEQH